MTSLKLRARPLGDAAVTITFGSEKSTELLRRIQAIALSLEAKRIPNVNDIVPAYLTLTVFYDALDTSYHVMAEQLLDACQRSDERESSGAPLGPGTGEGSQPTQGASLLQLYGSTLLGRTGCLRS